MKNLTPISDKDLALITRHFDYALSEEETDQFYERLDTDAQFEAQVNHFKKVHETSLSLFEAPAKKETTVAKLLQAEKANKSSTRIIPLFKQLAIAASLGLGIWLGYQFINNNHLNSTEAIAESVTYLHQINLDEMARSEENPKQENIDLVTAYNVKDYAKCIELTEKTTLTSDEKLVRGIAFLELKELEKAKDLFLEEVTKMDGQRDVALWGLVHIHLKQGDIPQAKKWLSELMDAEYVNPRIMEKAKNIFEKLPK